LRLAQASKLLISRGDVPRLDPNSRRAPLLVASRVKNSSKGPRQRSGTKNVRIHKFRPLRRDYRRSVGRRLGQVADDDREGLVRSGRVRRFQRPGARYRQVFVDQPADCVVVENPRQSRPFSEYSMLMMTMPSAAAGTATVMMMPSLGGLTGRRRKFQRRALERTPPRRAAPSRGDFVGPRDPTPRLPPCLSRTSGPDPWRIIVVASPAAAGRARRKPSDGQRRSPGVAPDRDLGARAGRSQGPRRERQRQCGRADRRRRHLARESSDRGRRMGCLDVVGGFVGSFAGVSGCGRPRSPGCGQPSPAAPAGPAPCSRSVPAAIARCSGWSSCTNISASGAGPSAGWRCGEPARAGGRLMAVSPDPIRRHWTICPKLHANGACRTPSPLGEVLEEGSERGIPRLTFRR
jgi:hypothetical protein